MRVLVLSLAASTAVFAPARVAAQVRLDPPVRVHFEGVNPGTTFELVTGRSTSSAYVPGEYVVVNGRSTYVPGTYAAVEHTRTQTLCSAPCEMMLPRGSYRFVVGDRSGWAQSDDVAVLEADSIVRGHFVSNGGVRGLGHFMLIVGMLGGPALALTPLFTWLSRPWNMRGDPYGSEEELAMLAGGIGAYVLVGWVLGLSLMGVNDHADVEVLPMGVRF